MARHRNATSTLHHYLDRLPSRGRDSPPPTSACDAIPLDNLRLVVAIARRYWFDGVSLDDLIQAGNLGLLRAARSFDGRTGDSTMWLSFGIRQAILDHLANHQHAVPLPRNVHQQLLRETTPTDLDPSPTARLRAIRLDAPTPSDDPERGARLLPAQPDEAPAAAELAAMTAEVGDLLETLDEIGRCLIVERFGLDGQPPRGAVAQAAERGVSREAIRLRYNAAMARLASEARSRRLELWLDRG